ncbi:MAG: lysophospholipase [Planctomyces sp.]|nr:lysophospholipase [Planctomyces sp.]
MQAITSVIPALDGTRLFVRRWSSAARTARTLLIVHGAGEHGARYEHFAAHVVRRGWTVIAADARGHGLSEGVPSHISSFGQYVDDLAEVLRRSGARPESTALFAHSLGGLITIRLLQTAERPCASAVVLSSPLLGLQVRVPAMKRALGRVCSWLAPETRFSSNVRAEQLTRSDWARQRRESDPHARRSVTAGWYFQVLDAVYEAWASAGKFRTPLLLQQGDGDEVVDPGAAVRWWSEAGARDRMFRLLPGHLHELASEPTWASTTDFVLDWLEPRVAAEGRMAAGTVETCGEPPSAAGDAFKAGETDAAGAAPPFRQPEPVAGAQVAAEPVCCE